MNRQQERFVRNEWLFREVNERIADISDRFDVDGRIEFLCECGRQECLETVRLSPAQYESVRAEGDRFAVKPGHERKGIERVLERNAEFLVVVKAGEAGEESEDNDPRP